MWFLFGFVTLATACVSSLIWRRTVSWKGRSKINHGIPYEYEASTVKRRVQIIRVGVSCSSSFSLSLKPEGLVDRASKFIGLTKECQTGDSAFDDAIYVLSDDLAFHRMLQLNANLRSNILRLAEVCDAEGKLKAIHAYKGRLWVVVDPDTTDRDEAERIGHGLVPALHHLAADFIEKPSTAAEHRDPFPFRAMCVLAISTGLAINGGVSLVRMYPGDFPFMLQADAPVPLALLVAFATILALVAFALGFMGRSSRAHLVLIELLLVGSFGTVTTAYAELRDYNMEFDSKPPALHRAIIIDKYETYTRRRRGGKTRHCHIMMQGWPSATVSTHREMSCSFYEAVQVGTPIDVRLRSGALGWGWVENFDIPVER